VGVQVRCEDCGREFGGEGTTVAHHESATVHLAQHFLAIFGLLDVSHLEPGGSNNCGRDFFCSPALHGRHASLPV